jgi:hypothetical protein
LRVEEKQPAHTLSVRRSFGKLDMREERILAGADLILDQSAACRAVELTELYDVNARSPER